MPDDYTALLSGSYWGGIEVTGAPLFITYSFPTTAPSYIAQITDPNLSAAALASWQAFSAAEAALARQALNEWGAASGIIFLEVPAGRGDINFQKLDFSGTGYDGAGGIAYRPFGNWSWASYPYFTSDLDSSGDVFMNSDVAVVYGTLLHEIGHALGLKHPTEVWTQWAANPPVAHAVWASDDANLTIMSQLSGGTGHLTAMDIQAIQEIYGTQAEDGTQVGSWAWDGRLTQNGTAANDAIRGISVSDIMRGLNGNDALYGLAGTDTIFGGAGNDTLDGGAAVDRLVGGSGDDSYYITLNDVVTELAGEGHDTLYAPADSTIATLILPAEVEDLVLLGSRYQIVNGNGLDNAMYAGAGRVNMSGLAGNDYLVGSVMSDTLTGGAGSDVIWSGTGVDRFVFASTGDFATTGGWDAIGDFNQAAGDRIDLRGIDPDLVAAGDQAFSYVGSAAFTQDSRYQLRWTTDGTNVEIQIDLNHDAVADLHLILWGVTTLTSGAFLL